ncbi:MAG: hypothetical protein WCJ30_13850 [Deltaproteobacteria bacterium]
MFRRDNQALRLPRPVFFTLLAALFVAACGPGNNGTDAAIDSGVVPGPDVVSIPDGALTCAEYARQCQGTATTYGLCCSTCPTGLTCNYSNPGVDAGANTVQICTKLCGNGADCPAGANGAASWCVRGLCYQSCEAAGQGCPTGEECVTLYGHSFCEAVTCF